jgi:signal transduction histidine kinase
MAGELRGAAPQARSSQELVAVTAMAAGLCIVAGAVAVSGSDSSYAWLEGLARALMVGAPIAVGLYALGRPPFARFGALLIVVGVGWFVAALSGSPNELVYSVGRVGGWLVEVAIVLAVLAFPSGRLPERADRRLVAAMAVLVLVLYLPTALLVETYPVPTPWTSCTADCPDNAFQVVASEPAFVEDVVRPVRELLVVAIFVGVAVRLGIRLRGASSVMRRTLEPVLFVAIFRIAVYAPGIVARRLAPDSRLVEITTWLIALALPAMAIAFLVGLMRWRLYVAGAMQDLAARLPGHAQPDQLRVALAEAFDDSSIEIVVWLGEDGDGHWADARGHPFVPPPAGSRRWMTEVVDDGARVAAIVHDVGLRHDDAFVATATSYALMTLDNQRLSAQTRGLLREVSESRARIQATADDERRRIERDLHDGAQQRLVALRIKLELVAEEADVEDPARADTLRRLGTEVEDAIDEVRSLARGIYPSALADRGLVEALRSAALRCPLPATVLAAGVGRYSREIETTAYFCSLEALQNAAKHAHRASAVVIELSDTGPLRVEVHDDGAGFDPDTVVPGAGFVNMRDRLSAVAGGLATLSSPGKGTRIVITIPPEGPSV